MELVGIWLQANKSTSYWKTNELDVLEEQRGLDEMHLEKKTQTSKGFLACGEV